MMDQSKVKLGIAPIAWTNDDMPDLGAENSFEKCISDMALAGYAGTEVGNKFPTDTEILKSALEEKGLQVCNQWFSSFLISCPFEEVERGFRERLDFLSAMGAKIIGISEQSFSVQGKTDTPVFGCRHIMDDDEWKLLCGGADRLGRIAAEEYGITLTYHHHMGTVVESAGDTRRLMENTDPRYVSLLFDSGHFAFCGEDPVSAAREYASRIRHVHLKDIRPDVLERVKNEKMSFLDGVREGVFTVPGDGCIDFAPVFKVLEDAGYEGYMVVEAEQDPARADPLEYALKARAYIKEKTGL